ncbi:rhodanese-like domain-containing protein [Halobaculum sp. CBA1158]|uniref:rhodanese-like domain-containing protein n=1 Tax=Halobaculum sp. CBA1158 TaxID=2904243 RepID=UPI001F418667|nr:rhodanese-like domain-containing protein [Halobaculum sp. CBA1158]UIP00897.1 rhodanese-like domain-containing protein [Halobaculum sp. CBA1158]
MGTIEKHAWDMAAEAEEHVEVLSVEAAHEEWERLRAGDGDGDGDETIFLDVRDVRERWIEGAIPGDTHAPRGMLEFWADPETEYYRDYFEPDRRYVCYCNESGRSALAAKALQEMGFEDVAHIDGGFTAWQEAGYDQADVDQPDYSDR